MTYPPPWKCNNTRLSSAPGATTHSHGTPSHSTGSIETSGEYSGIEAPKASQLLRYSSNGRVKIPESLMSLRKDALSSRASELIIRYYSTSIRQQN